MLKLLDKTAFSSVFKIMEHSFPTDERRPYEEQEALLQREQYRIVGAMGERGELAGFMAVWEFPEFLFLEHFAVAETYRNRGMGAAMLRELQAHCSKPICLEAELPNNELSRRRVAFYERNGFSLNPYPYVQPPISEGRNPVPLAIMTTGGQISADYFSTIKDRLYSEVYHVSRDPEMA